MYSIVFIFLDVNEDKFIFENALNLKEEHSTDRGLLKENINDDLKKKI